MQDGALTETEVVSPQGGIVSPLLANIYLDEFDPHCALRGRYPNLFKLTEASKEISGNRHGHFGEGFGSDGEYHQDPHH